MTKSVLLMRALFHAQKKAPRQVLAVRLYVVNPTVR